MTQTRNSHVRHELQGICPALRIEKGARSTTVPANVSICDSNNMATHAVDSHVVEQSRRLRAEDSFCVGPSSLVRDRQIVSQNDMIIVLTNAVGIRAQASSNFRQRKEGLAARPSEVYRHRILKRDPISVEVFYRITGTAQILERVR